MVLDEREEAFARAIFDGLLPTAAFRKITGKTRSGDSVQAGRLLRKVQFRVDQLRNQAAEGRVMTKREEMEFLTEGAETPVGKIDENSRLCQSYKINADGSKEFKMVDKMRCIDLLAKMKAEFPPMEQAAAPVNVSVNVTVMSEDRRAELMTKKRQAIEKRRGIPANN